MANNKDFSSSLWGNYEGDCQYLAGVGYQCPDGSYYDEQGNYYPVSTFCKGAGCPPQPLAIFDTKRPNTNTVYVHEPQLGERNLQGWLANLMDQKGVTAQTDQPGIFDGLMGTIRANPLIALGGLGLLAYFFLGSGTGTYEQVTTKKRGFS